MRVTPLHDAEPRPRRVAVGTFDGVHLGHREVIRGADTVLTFDPHPLAVLHPEALPKLLDSFAIKRDLIGGLGVEELVTIPFDRDFAARGAEEFAVEVLAGRLGATHVSVGENFRFGHRAQGDAAFLQARDEFQTRVVTLVEFAEETVSSSHIRGLVAAGDMAGANAMLGRPFMLEGEVVRGDGRGRTLGMPTANVVPDDGHAVPAHGVYAAHAWVRAGDAPPATPGVSTGKPLAAAVNVGVRPQFATGRGLLVEAHLIDFEGELYGQELRIAFLERLRGERRFESVDRLVEQMWRDVGRAGEVCSATVARR